MHRSEEHVTIKSKKIVSIMLDCKQLAEFAKKRRRERNKDIIDCGVKLAT